VEQLAGCRRSALRERKLAQVDATVQDKQNFIGVRMWTQEEWLSHRDAQKGRSGLIADEVSDAVAIDPA